VATPQHINHRVTNGIKSPSGWIPAWYHGRVIPADLFLSLCEQTIVGLFVFQELIDLLVEDDTLEAVKS
jgi:hypothetical protein